MSTFALDEPPPPNIPEILPKVAIHLKRDDVLPHRDTPFKHTRESIITMDEAKSTIEFTALSLLRVAHSRG